MPYKRKHPALVEKKCEKCGVMFWVTSAQLKKRRCGDYKTQQGCSAEIGRLAQARYRARHPGIDIPNHLSGNYQREINRAQERIKYYVKLYGKEVVFKWVDLQ